MRRFEIVDISMAPALLPGDYVFAVRDPEPTRGAVVTFEHSPGFWLVKRVDAVAGEPVPGGTLGPGQVWVLSDNRTATMADSRTFGPIDTNGMYRVVWRYWPVRRIGWARAAWLPSR